MKKLSTPQISAETIKTTHFWKKLSKPQIPEKKLSKPHISEETIKTTDLCRNYQNHRSLKKKLSKPHISEETTKTTDPWKNHQNHRSLKKLSKPQINVAQGSQGSAGTSFSCSNLAKLPVSMRSIFEMLFSLNVRISGGEQFCTFLMIITISSCIHRAITHFSRTSSIRSHTYVWRVWYGGVGGWVGGDNDVRYN